MWASDPGWCRDAAGARDPAPNRARVSLPSQLDCRGAGPQWPSRRRTGRARKAVSKLHTPTAEPQLKMLWSRSPSISEQMLPSVKCLLKKCVILPPTGCSENPVVRPPAWACATSQAGWDPGPRQGQEGRWLRYECGQVIKASVCAGVCLCKHMCALCMHLCTRVCA